MYSWVSFENILTHWGRVTHICIIKLTIIGSNNGLSPDRRRAIIWINAGILLIGPLGTNSSEILIEIHAFAIQENAFENVVWKMAAILSRPQCVKWLHYKGFTKFSSKQVEGQCQQRINHLHTPCVWKCLMSYSVVLSLSCLIQIHTSWCFIYHCWLYISMEDVVCEGKCRPSICKQCGKIPLIMLPFKPNMVRRELFSLYQEITVMSHECHGVWNKWHLKYLLNSFLSWQKKIKAWTSGPLWGESTGDWWIPLTKGPVMRKAFPCHDVII